MPVYKRTELLTTLKHVGILLIDHEIIPNTAFLTLFNQFNVRVLRFDEDELLCNDDVAAILTNKKGVFEEYFTVVMVDGIEFRYPFIYGWVSWDVPVVRVVRVCELGKRIREISRIDEASKGDNVEISEDNDVVNKSNEISKGVRSEGEEKFNNITNEEDTKGNSTNINNTPIIASAAFSKSDRSLLDLLITKREKQSQRNMQQYSQHLKKCAMSLFAGASTGRVELFRKSSSTKKKLSAKQQQIVKQNEERLKKISEEKDRAFLRNFFAKFKSMTLVQKKMALESVRSDSLVVNRRITLLKIEYYLDKWRIESRKERVDERLLVDVYVNCLVFFEMGGDTGECAYVEGVMREIGFGATADELLGRGTVVNDLDVYFQLKFAGDKLKRTLDSRRDERTTFMVDSWQKELLDAVDNGTSCVISAPTSSGKTFICFYAIEKAIAEGTRLIFCVPTKALVNQVAADILIRFGDRCKYGIVMPDYQVNADCDVLVTVPMMLEALLENAPCTAHKRAKHAHATVIIDEIHKINSDEMGAYIERSVHKVKGPLVVLSATLGDNNGVYEWICAVERMKGKRCVLVEHAERYCELKNYFYNGEMVRISPLIGCVDKVEECNEVDKVEGKDHNKVEGQDHGKVGGKDHDKIDGNDNKNSINNNKNSIDKNKNSMNKDKNSINNDSEMNLKMTSLSINNNDPVNASTTACINATTNPANANLLPEDVLKLYYSVFEIIKDNKALRKEYKALRFKNYFKSNVITKKDVRAYCTSIFTFVKRHGLMARAVELMNNETVHAFSTHSDVSQLNTLISTLKKNEMLPCIVFNMDRDCVNAFSVSLLNLVQKNEVVRKVTRIKIQKPKGVVRKKDEWIEESAREEEMSNAVVPRDDYMIERISDEELDELVADICVAPIYKKMLYYGIGVHHNGMNKKYREIVEILFRNKNLGVVFSTHTLSLGINMPCKTVVFAGDSDALDRISVVQMSGRAGRRGYDTVGHVIFVGFEGYRVRRLMRDGESVVKGYSNSVYGWMWGDREYMRSMGEHCFSVLSDGCRSSADEGKAMVDVDENNNVVDESNNVVDERGNRVKDDEGSIINDKGYNNDTNTVANTNTAANTITTANTAVNTASNAVNRLLLPVIKCSPYKQQIINIFDILVHYDFIKIENGSFYRTKWGDVLLFNEMCDPLLFLVLLRDGAIALNELNAKAFFMVLCHFIEVRWVHAPSKLPILDELPARIQQHVCRINTEYPFNLKITPAHTQLIPPFLHGHPCSTKDAYLYNFFVSGRKGCEHVPMGDLWQICFRVDRLLGSLVDVVDGRGRRVVKDVYEVFRTKFEELHA